MSVLVTERHWTSKARLLRLLAELDEGALCRHSVYLTSESLATPVNAALNGLSEEEMQTLTEIFREVGPSDTGAAVFMAEGRATAVLPPFPLKSDSLHDGASTGDLRYLLEQQLLTGVVLLRMGRYAVAVLRGEILSSTTDYRVHAHVVLGKGLRDLWKKSGRHDIEVAVTVKIRGLGPMRAV